MFVVPAVIAAVEAVGAAGAAAAAATTAAEVGATAAAAGGALAAGETAAVAGGTLLSTAEAASAGGALAMESGGAISAGTASGAGAGLAPVATTAQTINGTLAGLGNLVPGSADLFKYGALASGALGAVQQQQAGQQQAAANRYNAKVAENNAIGAVQAGTAQEGLLHARNTRSLASAANQFGASGVQPGSGSPLDVMASMAGGMAMDEAMTRWNSGTQAASYGAQAGLDRFQAQQAGRTGLVGAGGSLLTAGMRAWGPAPTRAGA